MRRGYGVLTSLLMLVPMIAIPLMAVFGIPELIPRANSSPDLDFPILDSKFPLERRVEHSRTAADQPLMETLTAPQLDLFQPVGQSATTHRASDPSVAAWRDPIAGVTSRTRAMAPASGSEGTSTSRRGAQSDEALAESLLPSDSLFAPVSRQAAEPGRSTTREVASGDSLEPLTWKTAGERLEALRIRQFELRPRDSQTGMYRFVCQVTSPEDRRISRRFEAEAEDPLHAVERTLQQVEAWNAAR